MAGNRSSSLYSLLKRGDENLSQNTLIAIRVSRKTARASRETACADARVVWFKVESENQESIHNHNTLW